MTSAIGKLNFTKAALHGLSTPAIGKRFSVYDTKTRGLHIVVTDTGTKTFYLRRKAKGQSERVLIGRFPDLTVEQARGKAGALNAAFARGDNPADLRRVARAELTLEELFQEYLSGYAKSHTKTWPEMEANFRRYLNSWGSRKLSTLTRLDVQRRHAELGNTKGHATANRVLELLSAVFNWGAHVGLCAPHNPAKGIAKYRIKSRSRFLQPAELPRFFQALAEEPNDLIRDYILVSLLAGQRKANVLAMRWADLDLETGLWTIEETKNGESHTVHLDGPVLDILKARCEKRVNQHVLPGPGRTGHLVSPKKAWRRVLQRAEIQDLRLHDLRRTLGSYMASKGVSLVIIGKALGHKHPSSTQVYARLHADPVREATGLAQHAILTAAGLAIPAEVIAITAAKGQKRRVDEPAEPQLVPARRSRLNEHCG